MRTWKVHKTTWRAPILWQFFFSSRHDLTLTNKCHTQQTAIAHARQRVFVFRGDIKPQTRAVDEPDGCKRVYFVYSRARGWGWEAVTACQPGRSSCVTNPLAAE